MAPGRVGGRVGESSKFGTGSGNCTKPEEWSIRTRTPKRVGRVGYVNSGSDISRNLGQGEDCCLLMSLPHDIAGRTRVCPCPVDRLVTYLGDWKGATHSQGRCKPEYDGFDDSRSDIVKFYDVGYPRPGPPCITIDEGVTAHEAGNGST